jgi:hypothetical protein
MAPSWLSEFKSLAAREAKLLRVVAVDYGDPSEPLLDPIWLEFEGSPSVRLVGGGSGQGLRLDHEPPAEETPEPVMTDLSGESPFAPSSMRGCARPP